MNGTSGRQLDRLIGYALILLAAVALAKVGGHLFLLADDPEYTFRNQLVRKGLTWAGTAWAFTNTVCLNWHPVTWLSHMLDVQLFGFNPAAHHLVNLALHIANTLLLFGFLKAATGARWPAAFVAALFAVHPLHVESVAWVAERKDLLCAAFWLLSMRAYLLYARRPGAARYGAVALFFLLGLMSKAMIVTLPPLLLLLDWWPLGRFARRGVGPLVAEKLPLLALAAAGAAVAYVAQAGGGAVNAIPIGMRAGNAAIAYVAYAFKAVWPHPLAMYYPHPADVGAAAPPWKVAAATAFLAAASGLAVAARARQPWLLAGWLWFLGTLVPVIGVVQVGGQAMADRYMYMPLVGLAVAAAWGIPRLRGRGAVPAPLLPAAGALCVAALAVATWFQVDRWHDTVGILEHTLSVTSRNWWAERHLGKTYEALGDYDKAALHYGNALRIFPNSRFVLKDLGGLLSRRGRPAEGADRFRRALALKPDDAEARIGLALALDDAGDAAEAERHYADALRADPGLAQKQYQTGVGLLLIGSPREAMDAFRAVVRLDPANALARNNLGVILGQMGRTGEAAAQFREALRLRPDFADAAANLRATEAPGANGAR